MRELTAYELFNPHAFYCDLIRELGRSPGASYPEPAWHFALRLAVEHDTTRYVQARNEELETYAYTTVYLERLYGSTVAKRNGVALSIEPVDGELHGVNVRGIRAWEREHPAKLLSKRD